MRQPPWWALPVQDDGETVAVLVARHDGAGGAGLPAGMLDVLRASAGLAEPLLRRWRDAERGLPRHALDALRGTWRKLRGPGHLAWKAGAVAGVAALALLLLWPVPDRVTANGVIEGRIRQVVTAPFDGFIAQVQVRPGERVAQGQLLARLDDRDLRLEQGKFRSERDQAAGKLRQAMSERDAPAMALAAADVQQAEAQLALVEARLVRAVLVAPMDGLLVSGDWVQQIGGPVETGKEMFEIAATDGFRVVLHVPDRDIARVQPGQAGALRLTGRPQMAYAFEVTRVTATAGVQDGVNGFRVEAAWQGDAPPLSPGMQGVGKVAVGRANLLTVWTRSSVDWLRLNCGPGAGDRAVAHFIHPTGLAMQTLLSEHWHAVRFLRPRLREGVQPLHRRLRGKPWVLLLDPLTQRFHRVSPQVWRVLELLDGQRTLDEVWERRLCRKRRPRSHAAGSRFGRDLAARAGAAALFALRERPVANAGLARCR